MYKDPYEVLGVPPTATDEECDFALYGRKCQEFVLKLIEKI